MKIAEKDRLVNIRYFYYPVLDLQEQDVLVNQFLFKSMAVVFECMKNGNRVLIHCISGISRSVSVAVSYLMFSRRFSLDEALLQVRSIRPSASPNIGFLSQLRLYERMGYSNCPSDYEKFRLELELPEHIYVIYRFPVSNRLDITRYKCKSCRKLLFSEQNVSHKIEAFCDKVLIEPMIWMNVDKDTCSVKHICGAKLGNFRLYGQKCKGCQNFVSPWIQINESAVDKVACLISNMNFRK
ncbi:unnamed protein product [Caenorhabditis auriculariae]|uniref:protein-tyrosine-phosphatase n=1 Tax=Caenorhabditis auriculariae TaxID=2777116 RepID=A0A8S1HCX6_9PELO|nr:unnamed protein product [Caenorhabditis auriculariae]